MDGRTLPFHACILLWATQSTGMLLDPPFLCHSPSFHSICFCSWCFAGYFSVLSCPCCTWTYCSGLMSFILISSYPRLLFVLLLYCFYYLAWDYNLKYTEESPSVSNVFRTQALTCFMSQILSHCWGIFLPLEDVLPQVPLREVSGSFTCIVDCPLLKLAWRHHKLCEVPPLVSLPTSSAWCSLLTFCSVLQKAICSLPSARNLSQYCHFGPCTACVVFRPGYFTC